MFSSVFWPALALLALLASAAAFESTVPVIAWSSKSARPLVKRTVISDSEFNSDVLSRIDCRSVNILFQQPEIHASDFAQYQSSMSQMKQAVLSAESSFSIPYVVADDEREFAREIVTHFKTVCGSDATVIRASSADDIPSLDGSKIYIILVSLAPIKGRDGRVQRPVVEANDALISAIIDRVSASTSDYFALYSAGGDMQRLGARTSTATTQTVPFKKRSLLNQYIFINTGIMSASLPIILGIVVAFVGINILLGVQAQSRFDKAKNE
ncbi:uncharacterized protein BJ171DRAFT_207329 [Polychytrium aggregatum]|uniref:uncharacterized protein n=1 Tax=Polychytrium aggregatum TaxID=110093 RepID=UPI0022FDD76C|nr:uncharacterized protein BJ171DRAFT_207329 [Polychytrium aggregatum]KAI9208430.1 hypothetical protein BJ171DRAFT_207329 [Polychytrium aggregatum]